MMSLHIFTIFIFLLNFGQLDNKIPDQKNDHHELTPIQNSHQFYFGIHSKILPLVMSLFRYIGLSSHLFFLRAELALNLFIFIQIFIKYYTASYFTTYNQIQQKIHQMFDQRKQYQLENKSHVRGKLNKEFFSSEQEQLERKRRQMKAILDEQVNQRKRQKQKQKFQEEKKLKQEDQRIRSYYAKVDEREKKISGSRVKPSRKQSGVYQSKVTFAEKDNYNRYRANSRSQLQAQAGDIPVMPVIQQHSGKVHYNNSNAYPQGHSPSPPRNNNHNSMGNIPLLQLSPEQLKREQKKRVKSKNPVQNHKKQREVQRERQRELERRQKQRQFERQREEREEKQHHNIRERRRTLEEQSLPGSRQHTDFKEIFQEINQQIEAQNRNLRQELKKNQQAISLLIGAVKSSAKLDKFRVQAQRILYDGSGHGHGQNSGRDKIKKPETRDGSKQRQLMLPALKLKHQSILHDYMFRSAHKANVMKAKTFK